MDEGIKKHIEDLKHLQSLGILDEETSNEINNILGEFESVVEEKEIGKEFKIKIKYINKSDNENPVYAKEGDSGFDLRANESGNLKPLERKLVSTGLFFELPDGYEMQIRPRSGLAFKHGITVLNTPGTVDCFTEDMLITTTDGDKHIKDIRINDTVISYNIEDGIFEKDIITNIFDTGEQNIIRITTDTGILEITENSEILTNNGWKFAKDLNYEDKIITK